MPLLSILDLSLSTILTSSENGKIFNEKGEVAKSLSFFERCVRAIGSYFNWCDSTGQACFKKTVNILSKELNRVSRDEIPSQIFIKEFRKDIDQIKVQKQLKACLTNEEEPKRSLTTIVKVVTEIGNKHLIEERKDQSQIHYDQMQIVDNPALKLSARPLKPQKSYPITEEAKTGYLNEAKNAPSNVKAAIAKAMDNIEHLKMEALESRLKECVDALNGRLLQLGMPSYAVAVGQEKSSQWCTELASPFFSYAPSSGISLGTGGGFGISQTSSIDGDTNKLEEDVIVLIEDASYSGVQIANHYFRHFITNRQEANRPLKLIIVCPFMSSVAYAKVNAQIQHLNGNGPRITAELITSDKRIKSVKEIFTEEEKNDIRSIAQEGLSDDHTLCYCDWRFPDWASFPNRLGIVEDKTRYVDYLEEQHKIWPPYKKAIPLNR